MSTLRRRVHPGRCPRCYETAKLQCAKCKSVSYCGREHQVKDWELGHKAECGLNLPAPEQQPRAKPDEGAHAIASEDWALVEELARDTSQRPLPLAGLANTGNTCYANAVLQCVMRVPELFSSSLLACSAEACEAVGAGTRHQTFTGEFFALVRTIYDAPMEGGEGIVRAIAPNGVTAWLTELSEGFNYGHQEDSHEFMRAVLRMMDHEAVKAAGGAGGGRVDEESTVVHRVFGGSLRSQIQCTSCHRASTSFEPFHDLSLEITQVTDTVEEELELFTAPERLDKENRFECPGCEKKVRAQKQIFIDEAPPCLVLHLKRFRLGFFGKVNKHLAVPLELNLRPYMTPGSALGEGDGLYQLGAVLVHLDKFNSASYGHYIAYVLSKAQGGAARWYRMDDSSVSEVPVEEVLRQAAYLLFYFRRPTAGGAGSSASGGGAAGGGGGGGALARKGSGLSLSGLSLSASRERLDAMDKGEEEGGSSAADSGPVLCKGGCGFYGYADGLCSKCYTDKHGKPPPKEEAKPSPPKAAAPGGEGGGGGAGAGAGGGGGAGGGAGGGDVGPGPGAGLPPRPRSGAVAGKAAAGGAAKKGGEKLGPNSPCPCGSTKKYKKCHGKSK